MSVPVLTQVYDETRRLAIAGSVVAPGDFRLKKLVPVLEKAGKKAPIFAKVAVAATNLIESDEKSSAAALLELTTLVNAILYTQGETGKKGKLQSLETTDLGSQNTQTSARVLKPLMEALTTKGSGRLEVISAAHQRGAFRDLRLISPALAALDDSYAEIGDFVAREILPMYGRAILPELRERFDPKGRGGHVRRLVLMHKLDAEGTREIVEQALDEGSKEVRIAAIECMGESTKHVPFLLEQLTSRARDIRSAALKALGRSRANDAVQALCTAIGGADLSLAVEPIRDSRNRTVTKALLEATNELADTLLGSKEGKEKDKKKRGKAIERMLTLLACLRGRDDKETEKLLLKMFEQRDQLAKLKGDPSGTDLVDRLIETMAEASPKVQDALVDAHASLPYECIAAALAAANRSRKPAEVYELFAPYLANQLNESKKRDPSYLKREALIEHILVQARAWQYHVQARPDTNESGPIAGLDPRWLDTAVAIERLELVQAFAVPGHKEANALLSKNFHAMLKKKDEFQLASVVDTMIRVEHPEATDALLALLKQRARAKYGYGYYRIGHLIPRLPRAEAVPKLEALLPTLPEKMADELVDYLAELKNTTAK